MVEEKVRVELTIYGTVQMVSFRYRVSDIADDLGIVGRIANEPDKTVHVIAEGEKTKIQEFIKRLEIRPLTSEQIQEFQCKGELIPPQPLAKVERIEGGDNFLFYTGKYQKFEIIAEEYNKELVNSVRTASHLIDRLRTDMYYNFQTLNNNYIFSLEKINPKSRGNNIKDIYREVKLRSGTVHAIKVQLPHAPLIIIKSSKGYVMCGYLDMAIANRLKDVAAKVTGVKTINDALDANVVEISSEAEKLNVKIGMTGRQFLNAIMKK